MGLDGFEFVEFAASERGILEPVFETMRVLAMWPLTDLKPLCLYRQGDINFIINYEPKSYARYFAQRAWCLSLRYGFSC